MLFAMTLGNFFVIASEAKQSHTFLDSPKIAGLNILTFKNQKMYKF